MMKVDQFGGNLVENSPSPSLERLNSQVLLTLRGLLHAHTHTHTPHACRRRRPPPPPPPPPPAP